MACSQFGVNKYVVPYVFVRAHGEGGSLVAAKGAKRVVVKKNRATFNVAPYYDSRSVGMGLTMKF